MPTTKEYLAWLQTTARQNAATKRTALDAALQAMTTAKFDTSGKFTGYGTNAQGAPQMGTIDVQHEENKRNIGASGEAAGMLLSGQHAQNLTSEEADWRSRVIAAQTGSANEQNKVTTDLAQQLAEYEATYGSPASSGSTTTTTTGGTKPPAGGTKPPGSVTTPPPLGMISPPPSYIPPPKKPPSTGGGNRGDIWKPRGRMPYSSVRQNG